MRQRGALLARHADFFHVLAQPAPLRSAVLQSALVRLANLPSTALQLDGQQVAVQQNAGQQVIEVVRDSSGQPSDDFHLLGFEQMFIHPLALSSVRQHRDQEGGLAASVAPEGHRHMSPELGTVFAPVALFDFERVALAPQQIGQQAFVWREIVIGNFAANFSANFTTTFRIKLASVCAGQFLPAVAEHSAERGIRFQNAAIELANANSNRRPFKHRTEAQIAVVVACRRKLGHHVHVDITPDT